MMLTSITGVVDLNIFISTRTRITKYCAVHWDLTCVTTLAPSLDDTQCPGRHAVDTPVCVTMNIADCYTEPEIITCQIMANNNNTI